MASIRRYKTGWRAEIMVQGKRRSKVLPTKRAAQDWATRSEYELKNIPDVTTTVTFGEALLRFAREVSPKRRGARWEMLRLEALARGDIGAIRLSDLTARDLALWRDQRMTEVAAWTVRREMGLMGAVLTQARREWGLIAASPIEDVRKPPAPPPRDRLPTADEMERLAHSAGDDLTTATARAWAAFRFSCETAMRAGEIVSLTPATVDLERRVARLPRTKNGTARDVPLSSGAVEILLALPPAYPLFGLNVRQLDALWRKLRDRAGVEGLRFHDARHYGITQLARRLDVLDLARMVGHRDLKMLMIYYNESAEDIAKRLG